MLILQAAKYEGVWEMCSVQQQNIASSVAMVIKYVCKPS